MGYWGTGILENDSAMDYLHAYFDLYDKGYEHKKIRKEISKDTARIDVDSYENWLYLAECQWKCGFVETDVLKKVEEILNNGIDKDFWTKGGASEEDIKERERELRDFVDRLKTPNPNPNPYNRKKNLETGLLQSPKPDVEKKEEEFETSPVTASLYSKFINYLKQKIRNFFKITLIIITLIFGLLICWFNAPISIKYANEIKFGNQFSENIKHYESTNKKLPNNDEWKVLEQLNPLKPYETFYPEYMKIDSTNFKLTYIQGFDSPYLTYDSRTKKWEMK